MKTRKEEITSKAIEIVENNPDGIIRSELIRKIRGEFPNIPYKTIESTIWDLDLQMPDKVW